MGIFISYRRGDSAPWAGRIYDSLVAIWGADQVFMDIDTLDPGDDFRAMISATLARSDVVLVVIGPGWLTAVDESGERRLDDRTDVHRTEVVAALNGDVRVIPVLVGDAEMPEAADLPRPLQPLAFRHAMTIEDRRFRSDFESLQESLMRVAVDLVRHRADEAAARQSRSEEEAARESSPESVDGLPVGAGRDETAEGEAARGAPPPPPLFVSPTPELLPQPSSPRAHPGRRRTLVVALGVGVAAVVAAGVIAVAQAGGDDDARSEPSMTGEVPPTTAITTTEAPATTAATTLPPVTALTPGEPVPLTNGPDAIVYDGDELWVTVPEDDALARINLESRTQEPVRVGDDPYDIAFGDGSLWVSLRRGRQLLRIDPETGRSVDEYSFEHWVGNVAYADGFVWMTLVSEAQEENVLVRFDVTAGAVTGEISVPYSTGIFVTDDSVFVALSDTDQVRQFDVANLNEVRTFSVGDGPDPVAVADGVLWVGNRSANTVSRIDLARPSAPDEEPEPVGEVPSDIVVDGDRVWVLCTGSGTLVLLDPATGERKPPSAPVGARPLSNAVVDETLWITLADDKQVVPIEVS